MKRHKSQIHCIYTIRNINTLNKQIITRNDSKIRYSELFEMFNNQNDDKSYDVLRNENSLKDSVMYLDKCASLTLEHSAN